MAIIGDHEIDLAPLRQSNDHHPKICTQLTMAETSGPGQAIAAASITHLTAAFTGASSTGYRVLTGLP
ncbi:hypothetical protein [Actinomadura roseirufa]|uniref:hypothetical protein n=1 Tax=Actinomadura roseirufa TaxID=2094049 RepID=UPI0010413606|nr:hypothetical protein [Actinomadura roseirufa]